MGESNLNQKKCVFKEPGTIDTSLFYIVSGSLKITISDNSDEHIIRFGYTNNFITALDSFITEKPSEYAIQAIKKTDLKIISKRDFLAFLDQDDRLQQLWQTLKQQLLLEQMQRKKDLLTSSRRERYLRVLERSPQLFQEIPHKYIASYLRMSPETLSR